MLKIKLVWIGKIWMYNIRILKKNEKDWSIVFYVWIMEFKIIDFINGIFVGEDCGKYVDFE